TTLTVKGLAEGSKYVFRVQAALPKKQVTDFSPNLAVFTLPKAPSSLVATGMSASRVDLTWDDTSTHETGERIDRSMDGKTFTTLSSKFAAYDDTNIAGATQYIYRVRATSPNASSLFVQGNFTTVPAAATNLAADNSVEGEVTVTWNGVKGATGGYAIERRGVK